jgi:Domain of unknown function (DUF4439)
MDFFPGVTTWSVVKDDTTEKRRPGFHLRAALLVVVTVLAFGLGVFLTPPEAPEPEVPPFSEQARASALAETLRLRSAGQQLADGSSGSNRQAFSNAVTLLTTQARALVLPGDPVPEAGQSNPAGQAPPSASAGPSAPSPPSLSAEALVAGLADSGGRRLTDAGTADGGMARLLAAVGTGQVLQASSLAAAVGVPQPADPAQDVPKADGSAAAPDSGSSPAACEEPSARAATGGAGAGSPEPTAGGSATAPGPAAGGASLKSALSTVVRTELETVYGYQVALSRLEGPAAQSAAEMLARHEATVAEAEALSRRHCAAVPPREAGYTLRGPFLEAPAASLGSLEAGTLPVYGDLVALSEGPTRQWAIAELVAAARRSARWGAEPGAVPGLVADTAQLPPLPAATPSP